MSDQKKRPIGVAISDSEPVAWERGPDGKLRVSKHEVWVLLGDNPARLRRQSLLARLLRRRK